MLLKKDVVHQYSHMTVLLLTTHILHDATAGTITVNGIGAYIGLAKVYNGGELTSTSEANGIEVITYNIVEMADGRMTLDIQFQPDGGYWTYVLTKN